MTIKVQNIIKALSPRFLVAAVMRIASPKTIYKWWRIDCNLWEEKVKILWFMVKMKYTVIGINAHLAKIHTLEVGTTTAQIVGVSLSGLVITANVLRVYVRRA